MGRSRIVLSAAAVLAVAIGTALAYAAGGFGAGSPAPGSTQELTLPMSDGVPLACSVTYPENVPNELPGGGHPGVILFPGFGQTHGDLLPAAQFFSADGYEALTCDARGTGASGGTFGLAGPRDVQDARDLFTWLSGQLGNGDIGAFGLSLGGAEIWNAAVAGVPFAAIAPGATWTDLGRALAQHGVFDDGVAQQLAQAAPASRWDPSLAQARNDLLAGTDSAAVQTLAATRSSRFRLRALTMPTLILQGRHDFSFDLDQALAAYRRLKASHELYAGDLGAAPAPNPATEPAVYLKLVTGFFDTYIKAISREPGVDRAVSLAHDPWDGRVSSFAGIPPTRSTSVTLPGTATLGATQVVRRAARLTGGPLETFGGGSVVVRYSGASGWTHLVAAVSVQGSPTPVTIGAAQLTKPSGLLRIPLLDEAVLLPRGKRLVVTVGATSPGGVFGGTEPAGATITLGRVTLNLSLLRLAVSR
ncbi:MAG TPA: CocE/NonD family hydrolase [Gaiellaceae bacterium]|nr:CocE/NonD family hydrolase [Gaiellaceae bacterium]